MPINRGFYMFKAFISQPLKRFRCTLPFDKSILSTFLPSRPSPPPHPTPCPFPTTRLSTSKFDECSTRRSPRESRPRAAKLQLHRRFDDSASLSDSFRARERGGEKKRERETRGKCRGSERRYRASKSRIHPFSARHTAGCVRFFKSSGPGTRSLAIPSLSPSLSISFIFHSHTSVGLA